MSGRHFRLSEARLARLQPLPPNKRRGVPRVEGRRVISGVIHVIRGGLMRRDAPAAHGPHETSCVRFARWSRAGVFDRIFAALAAGSAASAAVMIDATRLEAHRMAAGLLEKGAFRAASDAPKGARTRSWTRSATATADP